MSRRAVTAPCVAAIDLGTTGVKAGIFDATGRLLALAQREQALLFPAPGRVEQSPRRTWELQCASVREAVRTSGVRRDAVVAVALSVQRGTVIALDRRGQPIGNYIVWMDRRGLGHLEQVRACVGADRYYDTAGHPLVPYTGLSKLLWLRSEAPRAFDRCRVVAPPQTLHLRWLGADDFVCDPSAGTFFFPFDIARATWSDALIDLLGFPREKLPTVVPSTTVVGRISAAAADACGLSRATRIVAGGGDGQCAAVGSGVTRPGRVMINIGTAAGVQTFLPAPRLDPRRILNCGAHVIPGAWEMEGHTQASGAVLRWVRDLLRPNGAGRADSRGWGYQQLTAAAAAAPPGARGLLLLPTFNGASAPLDRPGARGALLGLTLAHTRADLVRAALEGITLELRWMLEAMRETGVPLREVRVVGGGARSAVWNQIHADVLGIPIEVLDIPDAAVAGAAVCAAVAAGVFGDFQRAADAFARPGGRHEPVAGHAGTYDRLYATYRRAFAALDREGVFADLGTLGGA
jgi:xylulokinase